MRFSTLIAAFMVGAVTAAPASSASPIQSRSTTFNLGKDKVRGLNIGGWLVLEPWISECLDLVANVFINQLNSSLNLPKSRPIPRRCRRTHSHRKIGQ